MQVGESALRRLDARVLSRPGWGDCTSAAALGRVEHEMRAVRRRIDGDGPPVARVDAQARLIELYRERARVQREIEEGNR